VSDFRLHWDDAEAETSSFAELDLPYCPRAGEKIWFEERDDNDEVVASVTVLVESVKHVVETLDSFAYVELIVSKVVRYLPDGTDDEEDVEEDVEIYEDEDLDERGCPCGHYTPEMVKALSRIAMQEIRRKEKLHDADAHLGRVQM